MNSKKTLLAALLAALMLTSGCGSSASQQQTDTAAQNGETGTSNVASASDMTEVEEVVEEGMTPISGDKVKDGTYSVAVKSSSKMFDITACELTVEGGKMTATMHMGGKGYLGQLAYQFGEALVTGKVDVAVAPGGTHLPGNDRQIAAASCYRVGVGRIHHAAVCRAAAAGQTERCCADRTAEQACHQSLDCHLF